MFSVLDSRNTHLARESLYTLNAIDYKVLMKENEVMNDSLKRLTVSSVCVELPSNLLPAEKTSENLATRGIEITNERLTELADAYYIPHYRVDGGRPFFNPIEARKWIARNLSDRFEGRTLPIEYRVAGDPVGRHGHAVPTRLVGMADHLIALDEICGCSGVYFLCRGDLVAYIGQSVCTGARIAKHKQDGRAFDRAYILPAPEGDLDRLEGAFIRTLNPPDNKVQPVECGDSKMLMEFGWVEQTEAANG